MKTIKAPDGYYYKKDSIYTTEINLPDGFSEEGWELVTEAEYQAYQRERAARMLEEELGMRRSPTLDTEKGDAADPTEEVVEPNGDMPAEALREVAEEGLGV